MWLAVSPRYVAPPDLSQAVMAEIHPLAAPLPTPRDVRLRGEVARLQKRLATLRDDSAHRTPRVMSLTAPGAVRLT